MKKEDLLRKTCGGIVVSCQALPDEPLYGSQIMARMAVAACQGGAVGIRCGFGDDIRAIKSAVDVPLFGLVKRVYPDSPIYITPTLAEVDEVIRAGAHVVALDCTARLHPGGMSSADLVRAIREKYRESILLMADISTFEEGIAAAEAGVDFVSTTLSGYTSYSPQQPGPDLVLMERLSRALSIPVFGEGRVWTPEEACEALTTGIHALIVGTAITRPKDITERFVRCAARIHEKGA